MMGGGTCPPLGARNALEHPFSEPCLSLPAEWESKASQGNAGRKSELHFKVLPSTLIRMFEMSVFQRMNFSYLGSFLIA